MRVFSAITAALVSLVSACSPKPAQQIQVSPDAIVIDNRTEQEYGTGHVEGAILIPYDVIGKRISEVAPNKDAEILLYCRSGRRSGIAQRTLKEMGYTNVTNLGGLSDARAKLGK